MTARRVAPNSSGSGSSRNKSGSPIVITSPHNMKAASPSAGNTGSGNAYSFSSTLSRPSAAASASQNNTRASTSSDDKSWSITVGGPAPEGSSTKSNTHPGCISTGQSTGASNGHIDFRQAGQGQERQHIHTVSVSDQTQPNHPNTNSLIVDPSESIVSRHAHGHTGNVNSASSPLSPRKSRSLGDALTAQQHQQQSRNIGMTLSPSVRERERE